MKKKKNDSLLMHTNIMGNLPKNPGKKPWYKKKSRIIIISSIFGVIVITASVALPLFLIPKLVVTVEPKPVVKLNRVTTVFNMSNHKVKLIVDGVNLQTEPSLYKVFNISNTKENILIPQNSISLIWINDKQIDLAFSDTTLSSNSIYKVVYDDGTPNIIEINSIIGQNVAQPVIGFIQQPTSVTIWDTTTNPITTLSVSAVIVQSPIHQKSINFQWYISNNASSGFAPIKNATNPSYEYDSSTINGPNKKYFKCIISYEYAESISSQIVYIEKLNSPIIKITYQSPSMTLPNLSTSTPLSVGARVENELSQQSLTYQWYKSDSNGVDATWDIISNATSATYIYNTMQNVVAGVKKYFKCKISYQYATTIESDPIYIERTLAPVISFNTQPSDVILEIGNTTTTATLSVDVSIANPVSGEVPNYLWLVSDNENGTNTSVAPGIANKSTYDVQINSVPFKKYYRCSVSYYSLGLPVESRYALVEKRVATTITIDTQPENKTLTSVSDNPRLSVIANIANPLPNRPHPTYQWKKSSTQNGTYVNIAGATDRFYDVNIGGVDKNGWRDMWYICDVSYVGASTPLVSSNPAFVKMTLTTSEARAELIKWFTIQSNYESILATFFNRSTSSNGRHGFYTSLHDYIFTTAPGTVEFVSAVAEQFIPLGLTTATTLYKIRLKTTSSALYRTRASGTNGATTELPVGSFVEFYTLFSFVDNNNQIQRTTGAHYNMNLTTAFSTTGQNTTSISWVSNAANAPDGNNPIKKGSYPIKYISADNATIFTDSLYLPSRPSLSSANITTIPTYNIRS